MQSFSKKHVLVLGLGLHGGAIGNIAWLASEGAIISVSDTKTREQLTTSIQQLADIPDIEYLFGNQDEINLDNVDMILRNPAVPRKAPILQQAREKHIPIMMDSSIFFEQVGRERIIGITGSKGKTTTSHAIFHVLKSFIPETIVVGIDGVSPLGMLTSDVVSPPYQGGVRGGGTREHTTPPSLPLVRGGDAPIVFELSSWRLEALQEIHTSPHIAVCTSIYKDHLNTYDSYEDYIQTKKQIILDQTKNDIAILNYDDEIIRTWEKDVKRGLYWYSLKPLSEGEQGIWVDGDNVVVRFPSPPPVGGLGEGALPEHRQAGEGKFIATTAPHPLPLLSKERGASETICTVSDIPHSSPHELRNKLPAILLALMHGATPEQIKIALQAIPQLKHRMQLVRELSGVQYINDTAATMPDATISALQALRDKPLILILGGSDKNLEFQNLAQQISEQKNLTHLIWLPGTATERMQQEILPNTTAQSHDVGNMKEAVTLGHQLAQPGSIVLLSPGATSFGLFLHEFDRGDAFIEAVNSLLTN